jgi:hypothetical protein
VASRYDATIVAKGYEDVYDRAIRAAAGTVPRFAGRGQPPSRGEGVDRAARRGAGPSMLQPAS